MKKIEATIKPSELKDVEDALDAIGIRSFSAQKIQRHGAASRRSELSFDQIPQKLVKIELIVQDAEVERVAIVLSRAALPLFTGEHDNGEIAVFPVEYRTTLLTLAHRGTLGAGTAPPA